MKYKIPLVAVFCCSGAVCAADAETVTSTFNVGTHLYSDRDDLKINEWSAEYRTGHDIFDYLHEKEPENTLLWSVKGSRKSIDQDDAGKINVDDYQSYEVSGTLAQKLNDSLSVELGLGDVTVKNKRLNEKNHLTRYGLKTKAKLSEQLTLQATHERNYLFEQGITEGDTGNLLHGDTTNLELYWRPEEKWRVEGKLKQQSISDGNDSQSISGSLLYGVSPSWPWIWTGVTAETLKYDEEKNSYWTPKDYRSYGLTADSSFAVNEDLSMSLGASLNRNKENNNPSGTGYSFSAGADWKMAENINLKAKGFLLESTQESSDWQQDEISLSVNVRSY